MVKSPKQSRLLSIPAEDLAARPPTRGFFEALLRELVDVPWTEQMAERLDYAYSEILLRAVAASRREALRELCEHLGRVIAVRRADLTADTARYFHRWRQLHDLAERCVLKRESAGGLLDLAWVKEVLKELVHGPLAQSELRDKLGRITTARLSQVLGDMERRELISRRKDPEMKIQKQVSLTEVGAELAEFLRKTSFAGTTTPHVDVQGPNPPVAPPQSHTPADPRENKPTLSWGGSWSSIDAQQMPRHLGSLGRAPSPGLN